MSKFRKLLTGTINAAAVCDNDLVEAFEGGLTKAFLNTIYFIKCGDNDSNFDHHIFFFNGRHESIVVYIKLA